MSESEEGSKALAGSDQSLVGEGPLLTDEATKYTLGEVAYFKTTSWDNLLVGDYNPDNITIETYLKMMDDAQVNAGAMLFKYALLSKPWDIKFPEGKEPANAEEIDEFLTWVMNNVNRTVHFRGGLRLALEDLLEGPLMGFAVAEPVYANVKYRGKTKVGMTKLKVVPQETITFTSDKYGNLQKVTQWAGVENILEPLSKFIIWPFNMRAGNWYGRPLLKKAYKHWYIKEFLIKKWNIFLERKAIPILYGKTRPANIKNLNDILSKVTDKTNLTLDSRDELAVLQTKNITAQFIEAIRYHDTMILRGLLTPTLLMGQEDVGARALGDTHFEVFLWVVNKMKEDMTAIVNGLLTILTKANFPGIEVMPEFIIPELTTEERDKFAAVIKDLVEVGVVMPDEKWIRQRLGFPPASETQDNDSPRGTPPEGDTQPSKEGGETRTSPSSPATKQNERPPMQTTRRIKTYPPLVVKLTPEYIKSLMDSAEDRGTADLREYVQEFMKALEGEARDSLKGYDPKSSQRLDYLAQLKKLKAPKDAALARLMLDTWKRSLQTSADYLVQSIDKARASAKECEIKEVESGVRLLFCTRSGKTAVQTVLFDKAKFSRDQALSWAKSHDYSSNTSRETANEWRVRQFPPEECTKYLGTKQEFNAVNSDTLKVLMERAFSSAGVLNQDLLQQGKMVLINGIQSGADMDTMTAEMEKVFGDFSANRLRTIVRTNVTAAFNLGATEIYRNTGGWVQGVMYQAILDDRTTDFCESHDGETLRLDDPRVDAMTPPNHYQCRSIWVPVTIADSEVELNTWNDKGPAPEAGFVVGGGGE